MATAASAWRRSQTSTAAKASSPTAGGIAYASTMSEDASGAVDRPDHSAAVAKAKAGHARRRRGAPASGVPAVRIEGTPTRLAATGAAQPRVIEAPTKPAATRASIAQRRSVGTSQTRVRAATSAPRSTTVRVAMPGIAGMTTGSRSSGTSTAGAATSFGSGRSIDHTAETHTTVTVAPTVARARAP